MDKRCERCINLDSSNPVYGTQWMTGRVFEHIYLKFVDVAASSRKGCRYCSLLTNVLPEYVPDWENKVNELSFHVIAPDNRPFEIRVQESGDTTAELVTLKCVFLFSPPEISIPGLLHLGGCHPIARNSADPDVFLFIQNQLSKCSTHQACDHRAETVLPKRVLVVGNRYDDVCLHETGNQQRAFAALSYCWGQDSNLLKTTQSTLETFKQKIAWQTIPKTIQDAIVITRKIGLRYIWVDCLCIIQDSPSDWEIESAKMCDYYRDSWITIAATDSRSVHDGILRDRVGTTPPKEINFLGSDGRQYSVHSQSRVRPLWPNTISELGPLADRAWTYQEHALSRRMLHFLNSEVIWECQTQMISEDSHPIRDNCQGLIRQTNELMDRDPQFFWALSVRVYSQRKMTFLKDKLPAISGIASLVHQKTGFRYHAGMWRETLERDLVWSSWGWENIDQPPLVTSGPSWSWASIHGGVAFATETISECTPVAVHCTIHDVSCQLLGQGSFGQATSGRLDISGPIVEMDMVFDGQLDDYGLPSYNLIFRDLESTVFFPDTALQEIEITDENGLVLRSVKRAARVSTAFRVKILCLWCLTADEDASETQALFDALPPTLHGIVLARAVSGSTSTYTRVGVVSTRETYLLSVSSTKRVILV